MKMARWLFGDSALAAVLAIAGVGGTVLAGKSSRAQVPMDSRGLVLFVMSALALAARRRHPLTVLVVVTACTSAYLILGYAYGPILLIFMLAIYSVARHAPWAKALPAALAALALMLIHLAVPGTSLGLLGVVPVAAWVVVPFALGFTLKLHHESAVRVRAEAIRQSVDDERFRVAQEVHDIVGHGLTAIKMQADVALHVLAKNPGQAEVALEAISRTSSQALAELRATLTVVRRPDADAELAPVPGLARLEDLRQRMAEAGVYVRLETSGSARAVPVAVDLTGYRIVQESLTNVLRHSASGRALVTIDYETGHVLIVVSNPVAAWPPSPGSGSGIPGMRDRVQALSGEFAAGLTSDHRFEVRARLPTGAQP